MEREHGAAVAGGGRARQASVGASVPPRPASLADTATDGALTLNRDGRFVASRQARRMFDHLLSALGELSPREVRALLLAEAQARVSPDRWHR